MEWFYEKNGTQMGPVTEAALKALLASGEITEQNLVWKHGMGDWTPYATVFTADSGSTVCPTCGSKVDAGQLIPAGDRMVCPNCRDSYAQGLKEGVTNISMLSGGRGTGGMTPNSELRSMARQSLSGNWGNAVAGVLILGVVWFILGVMSLIPILGTLIQFFTYGPLMLGFVAFFMSISRQERSEIGTIFSGFSQFWKSIGIYFMISLITGLVALAAAIPGIILIMIAATATESGVMEENPLFILGIFASMIPVVIVSIIFYLRYALVYFIVNDQEGVGVFDSMSMSAQMMKGRKMKLFLLGLSFIGWHILGMLAFSLGLLWSYSYMMTAFAAFYDDLGEES